MPDWLVLFKYKKAIAKESDAPVVEMNEFTKVFLRCRVQYSRI